MNTKSEISEQLEQFHANIRQRLIISEVVAERIRQTVKWGVQDLDPFMWIAVLSEEVGEVSKAILDTYNDLGTLNLQELAGDYRNELIQVAAVAIQAIECLDKQIQQK